MPAYPLPAARHLSRNVRGLTVGQVARLLLTLLLTQKLPVPLQAGSCSMLYILLLPKKKRGEESVVQCVVICDAIARARGADVQSLCCRTGFLWLRGRFPVHVGRPHSSLFSPF
jgi:hypothetical protein